MLLNLTTGRRGGVPSRLMRENNQTTTISSLDIPVADSAVQLMESQGSQLTHFSPFGTDPLANTDGLVQQREDIFNRQYPKFSEFFHSAVNGNYIPFHNKLLFFIQTSNSLIPL